MSTRRLMLVGTLTCSVIAAALVAGAPASVSGTAPRVVHRATSIVSSDDADLLAEAGEPFSLSVEVRNIGDAPATGITGELITTAFPIQQASSAYPDLAPGAAAVNTTPFAGTLPANARCGETYGPIVRITTQQGVFTIPVAIPVSGVGAPISWTSTTPLDIPDLTTVEAPLLVSGAGTGDLLDFNVRINDLRHTFDADLFISLVPPGPSSSITLVSYRGFGENFIGTVLDDEADVPIERGIPPFGGVFRPDSGITLAAYDGWPASGVWKLRIRDAFTDDTGRLNSWGIDAVTLRCNQAPTAGFDWTPLDPIVGKPVSLTSNSSDGDGQVASVAWDLDNDGAFDDGTAPAARTTFPTAGTRTVRIRAVDDGGNAAVGSQELIVVRPRAPRRVCRVPRVTGRKLAAARRLITRGGCRVGRVRRARSRRVGRVIRQSPRGGAQRARGTRVNLVVGRR